MKLPLAPMIDGLKITFENFFRSPTLQYPEIRRPELPRERGMPVLRSFPDTGECRCIACGLCEVVCPGHCLEVHAQEEGGDRRVRILQEYILDVSHCLFCGYCAAACPVELLACSAALRHAIIPPVVSSASDALATPCQRALVLSLGLFGESAALMLGATGAGDAC